MKSVDDHAVRPPRALRSQFQSDPAAADGCSCAVWVLAIGLAFYNLSNPLALQPNFGVSFERAMLVTLGAVLITLPRLRRPRPTRALGLLVLLMALSATWSVAPTVSWGIFELYLKLALLGLACATYPDPRTIAYGMTLGGVIVFATSVYAYVVKIPIVLVEPGSDGYLAGVGTNRNILAYTLILSFAAAVAVVPRQWWARVLWGGALAMISVGLFLSQSGTGFVAAGFLAAAAGALGGVRRWRSLLTGRGRLHLSLGAALLLVCAVVGWPAMGALLGRDTSTLSGRTELWGAIWRAVADDRLLGQGWGTVWGHPWAPAPPNQMFDVIYFDISIPHVHGHNSLFDVLPELGLVGVLLVVLAHLAVLRRGWSLTTSSIDDDWATARLSILGVLALALFGVTEPIVTIPLGWFFLVTLSGLGLRERRRADDTHTDESARAPGPRRSDVSGDRATTA